MPTFLACETSPRKRSSEQGLVDEIVLALEFRVGRNQVILMIDLHAMARIEDQRGIGALRAMPKARRVCVSVR